MMAKFCLESANWYLAATLRERVASLRANKSAEQPGEGEAELAEQQMQRWRSQAPFADRLLFDQRLAADGLSEDDLLYCLGEPVEILARRLAGSQDWLEQIVCAFSRPASSTPLPLPENVRSPQTAGFLNLIEPLLRDALDRVQEGQRRWLIRVRTCPSIPPRWQRYCLRICHSNCCTC